MTDVRVVLVTGPDEETLGRIGRLLVEERLIACANVLPGVRSIYRWEGAVEDEAECLAVLKTRRDLVPALEARIGELHPYDVPEFLVLPVESGSDAYLAWVESSTTP